MSIKLKISKKTADELDFLSDALNLRRNVICRMAIGISLSDPKPPDISIEDSSGQEFNKPTIMGTDESTFKALISQHYGKKISDEDFFSTYVRAEITRGVHMMFERYRRVNSQVQFFEELCTLGDEKA